MAKKRSKRVGKKPSSKVESAKKSKVTIKKKQAKIKTSQKRITKKQERKTAAEPDVILPPSKITEHKKIDVSFRIFRYNPETEKKEYKTYKLNVHEGKTILDCLDIIKAEHDGTLTYRKSCRSAICGSCCMKVNGHAKLTCKTQLVDEIRDGEITIEPMNNLKVIKDLVVDDRPFWEQIEKSKPWLENKYPLGTEPGRMYKEDLAKQKNAENCIMCMACYTDCQVVEHDEGRFLGPAALTKAYRFVVDPRSSDVRERLKDITKKGLWHCAQMYACTEQCPKDIRPSDKITALREMAIQAGITHNDGARHARAFETSMKEMGELNEIMLPIRTYGMVRAIKFIPMAIKMAAHGKVPPVFPEKSKGMDEIKTISKLTRKIKTQK